MAEEEKKKSSCGCCFLKVLGAFVAMVLLVIGVFGYFAYQAEKWGETVIESTPKTYPPLIVSPGEKEDVDRIIQHIQAAKHDKSVIDETITPAVFNGIVDTIVKIDKEKGKEPEFDVFRGGIDGDHFTVVATKKVKDKSSEQKYFNVEVAFDCEIENGHFNKLKAAKIVAGGKEAPSIVKWFINMGASKFVKAVNNNTSPEEAKKIRGFNLVKRQGDRVHIILDPAKFDEPDKGVPAPKAEAPNDSKKESF